MNSTWPPTAAGSVCASGRSCIRPILPSEIPRLFFHDTPSSSAIVVQRTARSSVARDVLSPRRQQQESHVKVPAQEDDRLSEFPTENTAEPSTSIFDFVSAAAAVEIPQVSAPVERTPALSRRPYHW